MCPQILDLISPIHVVPIPMGNLPIRHSYWVRTPYHRRKRSPAYDQQTKPLSITVKRTRWANAVDSIHIVPIHALLANYLALRQTQLMDMNCWQCQLSQSFKVHMPQMPYEASKTHNVYAVSFQRRSESKGLWDTSFQYSYQFKIARDFKEKQLCEVSQIRPRFQRLVQPWKPPKGVASVRPQWEVHAGKLFCEN